MRGERLETGKERLPSPEDATPPGSALPRLSLTSHLLPLTFVFAGGGSGGHLTPGLAVAEELAARDPHCRIVFAGSGRGIEQTVLAGTPWRHSPLHVLPPGAALRRPIAFTRGMIGGLHDSLRLLDELKPAAVIGLGGFASVPVALAARRRRVPLILLEQNVIPGRATSFLSRWAEEVCVSFAETIPLLPRRTHATVTGNPLRAVMRTVRPRPGRPTLLILGGSQGAAGVNAAVTAAVERLKGHLTGWRITHQTGERDAPAVRDAYARAGITAEVAPFVPDLPPRYAQTTLAISRAGATSLAELACAAVPAVLIPYPHSVRDHQQRNAQHFADAGAAVVVLEGNGTAESLTQTLADLLNNPERLAAMSAAMRRLARPDAAEAVADRLLPRAAQTRAA